MPVRINDKKNTTFSGEHLIPQLSDPTQAGFVSVKSGKPCSRGAVVYLGRDVTPEMMLEQYCQVAAPPQDRDAALHRLEVYCEALQSVKIGNVLSVSYSNEGLPLLKVEQEYFMKQPERKLP